MREVIVAVAQQSLHLYETLDAYTRDIERFFRLAEEKHARLLVFPERTALMVIPPLVENFRSNLLKKADPTRRRSSWWDRTRSNVLRHTARLLRADMAETLRKALTDMPDFIWEQYVRVFSDLAYEYKMTVVAGSGYFRHVETREMQHITTVFGPDGDILGQHAKVLLDAGEEAWIVPGRGWQTVETPVGRLGIVMGEEVMYPEVGRLLAYQGMDALIALAATTEPTVVDLLWEGLKARVTDNQIFAALAFVVGPDPFAKEDTPPYRGRSVLMAPHGLTAKGNGIIVEAGTSTAEVLVTARWDFQRLRAYWENAPIPVRQRFPAQALAPILSSLYNQALTLEEAREALQGPPKALPETSPSTEESDETEQALPPAEHVEEPHVITPPAPPAEGEPSEPVEHTQEEHIPSPSASGQQAGEHNHGRENT